MYISRNWKISIIPCVLMLLVFIISSYVTGSGELSGTLIGVMVPVGVIVTLVSSRYMYKKGWLGGQEASAEQQQENAQEENSDGEAQK